MTRRDLPYGRQWITDADVEAVETQLRSDWLTQGPRVAEFEAALCAATGAQHAVAVSSGTAALHLGALVAGIGPGKVGVTSAITFVASANCIAYAGGTPAFADVDPATGLIATDDLERRCEALAAAGTPPALLIPVDLAGQPCDLPEVQRIARRFGALVIEDAAHSLGASYVAGGVEQRCGACVHSDLAILSFHPVKHITTGEGGALLTNDAGRAAAARELRSHGITRDAARLAASDGPWYHEQHALGFHYRLTDVQCALGLSQMSRLPELVARRRELAARYDAAMQRSPLRDRLRPLVQRPGSRNSYHLYVVRLVPGAGEPLDRTAARRRALYEFLVAEQIRPQVHYIPVPRQPWYRREMGTDPGDFPGALEYYAGCLSLPLFPAMDDADVDRVVAALEQGIERACA